MEIARALESSAVAKSGRRFLVTAHADEEPAKSSRHFKSSWELTAARAVVVVEYLVSLRVPAGSLVAAGAGTFDPTVTGLTGLAAAAGGGVARKKSVEISLVATAQ